MNSRFECFCALWLFSVALATAQPAEQTKAGRHATQPQNLPDLATLVERSSPRYTGAFTNDGFGDLCRLRDVGDGRAVPLLEQVLIDNARSTRIHKFAAAQALFCIGTSEAHQVLARHVLTPEHEAHMAFNYVFHWSMKEPQRSQFVAQYLLRNLSQDLVVELQLDKQKEGDPGQVAFKTRLRNVSDQPLRIQDRRTYLGRLLYLRSAHGAFVRSMDTVKYSSRAGWLDLKPGQAHEYRILAAVRPPTERHRSTIGIQPDSVVVLQTEDVCFDIGRDGRFEVYAMVEAAPLTEPQKWLTKIEGAWSGRAVSKPVRINVTRDALAPVD